MHVGPPLAREVLSSTWETPTNTPIELTAAVGFKRRGVETKLILPGMAQQKDRSRCDPALIKAIARGSAWFEELATGVEWPLLVGTNRDAQDFLSPSDPQRAL
jgi:hypothetical protein